MKHKEDFKYNYSLSHNVWGNDQSQWGNKKPGFLLPQTGSKTRGKKKHTSTGVTKADNFNYLAALERAETMHI